MTARTPGKLRSSSSEPSEMDPPEQLWSSPNDDQELFAGCSLGDSAGRGRN